MSSIFGMRSLKTTRHSMSTVWRLRSSPPLLHSSQALLFVFCIMLVTHEPVFVFCTMSVTHEAAVRGLGLRTGLSPRRPPRFFVPLPPFAPLVVFFFTVVIPAIATRGLENNVLGMPCWPAAGGDEIVGITYLKMVFSTKKCGVRRRLERIVMVKRAAWSCQA